VTAPPPSSGSKKIHIKYITQIKSRPPAFALFCNAEDIPTQFSRFLRTKIQEEFKLQGVPVQFVVRKSAGAPVKKELLTHGRQSRRGAGNESARPVGLKRTEASMLPKLRFERDQRRRRESRLRRRKSPPKSFKNVH
jgi:hypothetical protein